MTWAVAQVPEIDPSSSKRLVEYLHGSPVDDSARSGKAGIISTPDGPHAKAPMPKSTILVTQTIIDSKVAP